MSNQYAYHTTDLAFIAAVKSSKSPAQVFRKLGTSDNNYRSFWVRCEKLELDTSHFATDKVIRQSLTDEQVGVSCTNNISRQGALSELGLSFGRASVKWIDDKIAALQVDITHWLGQGHLKGKTHNWTKGRDLNEILVQNSDYLSGTSLKRRLIKLNLLTNQCYECGMLSQWNDKPLVLQLDHINGDHRDNRLENLRLLCPNCHSQTDTFASKNRKGKTKTTKISDPLEDKPKCLECGKEIKRGAKVCGECYRIHRKKYQNYSTPTKITWPDDTQLLNMVQTTNYSQVARLLGVSNNAIKKRLQKRGLV